MSSCAAEGLSGSLRAGTGSDGASTFGGSLSWGAGRFDGFWESNLRPWDMAAGIILTKEAGGYATDMNGKDKIFETGSIVAGNETIQLKLLKILKSANAPAPSPAKTG